MTGRGRPADQRREGTGRAADDDVLRRTALEPDGVDKNIEQDRDGQDARREQVCRQPHQDYRESAQPDTEMERRLPVHATRGERATRGALHLRVEIALIPLVERT